MKPSAKRWRAAYRKAGLDGLQDTRKIKSRRPLERELSLEEKYARLEAKTRLLEAENCWDNAPQESFFGHLKDETNIKDCETLEEVKREIKSYMTYYNHYRGQWNLKKLPPAKYRQQLQQVT